MAVFSCIWAPISYAFLNLSPQTVARVFTNTWDVGLSAHQQFIAKAPDRVWQLRWFEVFEGVVVG